jgi:hypothetical protein
MQNWDEQKMGGFLSQCPEPVSLVSLGKPWGFLALFSSNTAKNQFTVLRPLLGGTLWVCCDKIIPGLSAESRGVSGGGEAPRKKALWGGGTWLKPGTGRKLAFEHFSICSFRKQSRWCCGAHTGPKDLPSLGWCGPGPLPQQDG